MRLASVLFVLAFALTGCGGGESMQNPSSPPTASTLSVGFGLKQLQFSWTTAAGAASYNLLESPDGVSAFTQVIGDIIPPQATAGLDIVVYQENWTAARFALDACNS